MHIKRGGKKGNDPIENSENVRLETYEAEYVLDALLVMVNKK